MVASRKITNIRWMKLCKKESPMSTPYDRNTLIIEEFRKNGGKVGGPFAGRTLLLLHTIGAKSGQHRINPVAYVKDQDRFVIIASKGGAPTNPDWYFNIIKNPEITIEVGTETIAVRAKVMEEPERSRLYEKMIEMMPGFADYRIKTKRVIPVVLLEKIIA
jgi:deazaflavin-dependent oxidoreductase (nitroreductase family)